MFSLIPPVFVDDEPNPRSNGNSNPFRIVMYGNDQSTAAVLAQEMREFGMKWRWFTGPAILIAAALIAIGQAVPWYVAAFVVFCAGLLAPTLPPVKRLTALGIWIKWGPTWKKTEQDGEGRLRDEMWKDIANLKLAKEDTSRRLTIAETTIAAQTIKLGQQAFVINLVLDELERVNPGNTIARQARMLRKMQANAMPHPEEIGPMAEVMSKLCKEPGSGDEEQAA